ncbi:MAG TPA: peptidoglycan-binding protein [Acidimicrobiales bacterium]|jgi:hypothetical protein|nr:peptidoglycan-binding protein [Acidimicrobiales bacterium]
MKPHSAAPSAAAVPDDEADVSTEQLSVTPPEQSAAPAGPHRRKTPWVVAVVLVLVVAGVGLAVANPFASGRAASPGVADTTDATGFYLVVRQDLSSQTQVSATLGYAGDYIIAAPSGATTQQVDQAQLILTGDQETLSADQQIESDKSSADNKSVSAVQATVTSDQFTSNSDRVTEGQECTGSGSASPGCISAIQKLSQDQTVLTQAQQQLSSAESSVTLDHDQNQAKVQFDQSKLQEDQSTLTALRATEVSPGTTYTWLPRVGDVINEDETVYSVSNEVVPLLYGPLAAYRAFFVGMSDGADVGELTAGLIALGFGAGLRQSNHYSSATTTAVERWQSAVGLPATGEVLLGQVVFEAGPIRVTSVIPSVGASVGGGDGGASVTSGGGGSATGAGGGGTVIAATSTTRQVSVALDVSQQSEVAVGDKVSITLPNNQTTPGVVSSVGTVATPSSGGNGSSGSASSANGGSGSSSSTITVLVNPTDPAATGGWDQASVNVTITTATVTHALVIPVDALLAQIGGGYGVEAVDADGRRRWVPVTLGVFDDADGLVQVTGTGLATGQRVVVPRL